MGGAILAVVLGSAVAAGPGAVQPAGADEKLAEAVRRAKAREERGEVPARPEGARG